MTQTTDRQSNALAQRTAQSGLAVQPTPMAIALATYADPQVLAVIRDQICPDATPPEMWQFLARCVSLGLDPFSRQMYFIKRQGKVSHQIGIDGFRSIADRTGELVGISEPDIEFDEKGWPTVARVTVLRELNGKDREFTGVARWSEFCPAPPNDFMWKKMPTHMLSKCAEAQAMRRAFPQKMGGLQTDAEAMGAEEIFAASASMRAIDPGPQYIERTDTITGEVTQVRAGDEWERLSRAAGEEPEPVQQRQTAAPIDSEYREVPPGPPVDEDALTAVAEAVESEPAPQQRPARQSRSAAPAGDILCSDPECRETGRPAKAMEGTNPPRCFGHREEDA